MTLLRLAVRLSLGSGRRDVWRAGLMVAGIALAVLTILVALTIPRALAAAREAELGRYPVTASAATDGPVISYTQAVLDGRLWGRMSVSNPGDRLPPGVSAWPAPGHSVVSPALAEYLRDFPDAGSELGTVDQRWIGQEGLASPAEFFSWTVAEVPSAGERTIGFGDRNTMTLAAPVSNLLWAELLILVGLPGLVFALGSLRMGYASRADRYDRLILLGVRPTACARLFGLEMVGLTALGYVIATVLFALIQVPLGSSGWLGITWWPSSGQADLLSYAVGLLVLCFATWRACLWTMGKRLAAAPSKAQRARRWPTAVGALALAGGWGYALTVAVSAFARAGTPATSDKLLIPLLVALVAGVTGILLISRPLIRQARNLIPAGRLPSLRLGLGMASHHLATIGRQLAAFITFIAIAGFSATLLAAWQADSLGDPSRVTVYVSGGKLSIEQRLRVVQLDFPQTTTVSDDNGRQVTIGACATIPIADPNLFEPPASCTDEAILGRDASNPTLNVAGSQLSLAGVRRTDDFKGDVFIPATELTRLKQIAVLPLWGTNFVVSGSDSSLNQLVNELRQIDPTIRLDYGVKDSTLYAVYTQQIGLLRAATIGGAALILLSLIAGLIEARWSTERSVIGQTQMGITSRILRASFALSLAVPLAITGLFALVHTVTVCLALGSVWGLKAMSDPAIWTTPSLVLLLGLALALAIGWVVGGPPRQHIRQLPD